MTYFIRSTIKFEIDFKYPLNKCFKLNDSIKEVRLLNMIPVDHSMRSSQSQQLKRNVKMELYLIVLFVVLFGQVCFSDVMAENDTPADVARVSARVLEYFYSFNVVKEIKQFINFVLTG